MADFVHEIGYTPLAGDTFDFVIPVLPDGHLLGDVVLPATQIYGFATIEEKIVGDMTLPMPYAIGVSGYNSVGEGDVQLPQVSMEGTCQNHIYELPQVSMSGWTGGQSDIDNGLAIDLQSGFNLPQVEVSGTCTLSYIIGDMTLPMPRINMLDRDRDGEEDDLIWIDTTGDGEPDTEFYDPIQIDTDGDGILDTWVENNFHATMGVLATGFYNLKQIEINGYGGANGDIVLPSIGVEGTMEIEQIMNIVIDVPKPVVVGSVESTAGFEGVIDVPKPQVVGSISQNPVLSIVINAPLPKVMGELTVTPPNDWEGIVNVPLPVVSGSITTTTMDSDSDSELTFGDTPQCIQ